MKIEKPFWTCNYMLTYTLQFIKLFTLSVNGKNGRSLWYRFQGRKGFVFTVIQPSRPYI